MKSRLLALVLAAAALPAAANTIYRCTDDSGGMLISNTKLDKSCKAVVSGPDSAMPAPKARPAATPSPTAFPKVGEETQKARDGDRRRILEQELASEQKNLEVARKDLVDMDSARLAPDRLQPYKERVAQHERNIEAINKELSSLR